MPFVVASCMMNDTDDIPDFNKQLQNDLAAIDGYLAANNITAQQDVDGFIRYVIHHDTSSVKPSIDSCVTANYLGRLMSDGTEFDKGNNVSFPLTSVIDGWKIGIPLLDEGDSATLYIPSGLAYGYYGYPPEIPRNANLIFNVGLTKVGTTYRTSDRSCN
ncbi:MAG TPA: FKBP-type peptidyl-prolyl cis-trans isomerase [Chryseosolibacter sp.]|nr:FKBP-type peptidyl-prolyl cis-trans isomerase [Chryseosolibacter sp.]